MGSLNLVLEYVPRTMRCVLSFLSTHRMRMKASRVQIYMFQLTRALLLLHQKDTMHCDVKPENILINPETHKLKLADFSARRRL